MGLCGSYDLNIDQTLFTCAWKTPSHTCESHVNKWDWILKSWELLETPCVKSVGKPYTTFSGSGRSQWRILAVTQKDLLSSPCSASAPCLQQKCDMKHQRSQHKLHLTPLLPTERPRNCIAHLFLQLQPGKHAYLLPTQVLSSIFVSWALLHLL